MAGAREFQIIFEPDEHTACTSTHGRGTALARRAGDVASRSRSSHQALAARTYFGILRRQHRDCRRDDTGDEFFLDSSGFDSPSRLLRGTDAGRWSRSSQHRPFRRRKPGCAAIFRGSEDGTSIPYFVVRPLNPTSRPTLLTATADSRPRLRPGTAACWAGCGCPAAPMCWPTSAAAGIRASCTRRQCVRAGTSGRRLCRGRNRFGRPRHHTVEQLGAQAAATVGC